MSTHDHAARRGALGALALVAACGTTGPDTAPSRDPAPREASAVVDPFAPGPTGTFLGCVRDQGVAVEALATSTPGAVRVRLTPPDAGTLAARADADPMATLQRWLTPAPPGAWVVEVAPQGDDGVALTAFEAGRFVDAHRFALMWRVCGAPALAGEVEQAWARRTRDEGRREAATMLAGRLHYGACGVDTACEASLRDELVSLAIARRAARAAGAATGEAAAFDSGCAGGAPPVNAAPADAARDFETWVTRLGRPGTPMEVIGWLRTLSSGGLVDPNAALAAELRARVEAGALAEAAELAWLGLRAFPLGLSDELRFEIASRQLAAGQPERARRVLEQLAQRATSIYGAFARDALARMDASP